MTGDLAPMAPCLPERAARSSACAPHHPKCGYTTWGSSGGGQRGARFLTPTSHCLPLKVTCPQVSLFIWRDLVVAEILLQFGLEREGRSRNL